MPIMGMMAITANASFQLMEKSMIQAPIIIMSEEAIGNNSLRNKYFDRIHISRQIGQQFRRIGFFNKCITLNGYFGRQL